MNILETKETKVNPSSYGYRPGRSPQQAIAKAERCTRSVRSVLESERTRLDHLVLSYSILLLRGLVDPFRSRPL